MTFNQWCCRYNFTPHARIPLEAIWNALAGGGKTPRECSNLLDELCECFKERRQ